MDIFMRPTMNAESMYRVLRAEEQSNKYVIPFHIMSLLINHYMKMNILVKDGVLLCI